MNRSDFSPHNFSDNGAPPQWAIDAQNRAASTMVPIRGEFSMSSPPDIRNVSDDRIHPQEPRSRHADFETTVDGDVVIVQPSFDEEKTPTCSPVKQQQDWQVRSPKQDVYKATGDEPRNPSSPSKPLGLQGVRAPRHSRNLSAHFFDATTLRGAGSMESADMYKEEEAKGFAAASRKHRRMMSGDVSNPNLAHRRINSIGNSAAVARRQHAHQRVDSAGLDILSAAADVSKDVLAEAAGTPSVGWETLEGIHQPHLPAAAPQFDPRYQNPTRRLSGGGRPVGQYVPGPSNAHYPSQNPYGNYPSYYPTYPRGPSGYPPPPPPPQQYPSQHPMYRQQMMYPPENRSRTAEPVNSNNSMSPPLEKEPPTATHQGSQTFVTAMATGGNKTLRPTMHRKNASTNTDDGVPLNINHHRKMSSFSSLGLGTLFGGNSSTLSPGGGEHPLKSTPHHRSTSSVSFLNSLDVVGMEGTADETFLRNIQESTSTEYRPPPAVLTKEPTPDKKTKDSSKKLASGGTSKRVRRKCTVAGCPNRVVQGGLCISHGAKRKTCKHPGCTKNVKKAGLCSTHGPARKRCEAPNCPKVAVQGGRCIAHGAKKRLCSVEECSKQAILAGMCKKHHDQSKGKGSDNEGSASSSQGSYCKEIKPRKAVHKSQHTRGLSIFHEMSSDVVQNLLNAETVSASDPVAPLDGATPPPPAREDQQRRDGSGMW